MPCTTTDNPRRPTVLLFTPWATAARVCAYAFRDKGTHSDTRIQVKRNDDGTVVADVTLGYAATDFTLTSIGLFAGDVYSVRVKYKNAVGWSAWSKAYRAAVPVELASAGITVPAEPELHTVELDVAPSHVFDVHEGRKLREKRMETGHVFRRLEQTTQRRTIRFVWRKVTAAERASIVAQIGNVIRYGLSFRCDFDGAEDMLAGVGLFPDRHAFAPVAGRMQTTYFGKFNGVDVYTIEADMVEVHAERFFTVGKSAVAGPDPIS